MDICLTPARAAASRRNGAKSKGPKTPEGKERSSQNALKHGFRAQKFFVVGDEKPREFDAFEAALVDELAPDGALQSLLAHRIARAAWRLERAELIEADLFARHAGSADLGLALIRDGNGARAFDTLLRYRGTTLAELWRALRLLKGLQAEAHAHATAAKPTEPEARTNPGGIALVQAAGEVEPQASSDTGGAVGGAAHGGVDLAGCPRAATPHGTPIEPEARTNPGEVRCNHQGPAGDAGQRLRSAPRPGCSGPRRSACSAPRRHRGATGRSAGS